MDRLIVGLVVGFALAGALDQSALAKGSLISLVVIALEVAFLYVANASGSW
ncbi:MAG: hypothetical protein HC802_14890 [Caldilineaceae bacterium]|nr:hypothetical protein [Caldilineaceae bacterium]